MIGIGARIHPTRSPPQNTLLNEPIDTTVRPPAQVGDLGGGPSGVHELGQREVLDDGGVVLVEDRGQRPQPGRRRDEPGRVLRAALQVDDLDRGVGERGDQRLGHDPGGVGAQRHDGGAEAVDDVEHARVARLDEGDRLAPGRQRRR